MRKGHLDAGKPSTKWILTQSGQEMHARKLKLLALGDQKCFGDVDKTYGIP